MYFSKTLLEYIHHLPHLSSEDVSEARRETMLTSGGRFQRPRARLPRGRWTSRELRKWGGPSQEGPVCSPPVRVTGPFPCALSTVHRAESHVVQHGRGRRGIKGLRDLPQLSQAGVPAARPHTAPRRARLIPPPPLPPPPRFLILSFSFPPELSFAQLSQFTHSINTSPLLFSLCPHKIKHSPVCSPGRPSDLSGLDRMTSSSWSPDNPPFPL